MISALTIVIIADLSREQIYDICGKSLANHGLPKYALEIGVLRGDNSNQILQNLEPSELILLDTWCAKEVLQTLYTRYGRRPWLRDPKSLSNYFGGDISEQATFDSLYLKVCQRFQSEQRVSVVKGTTADWKRKLPSKQLNYVYLDASHQYEDVLDDLIAINEHAADTCFVQLNDCFVSNISHKQNIGVLSAVTHFLKLYKFKPLVLTLKDHDLLIARGKVNCMKDICSGLDKTGIKYITIPPILLGACFTNEAGCLCFDT